MRRIILLAALTTLPLAPLAAEEAAVPTGAAAAAAGETAASPAAPAAAAIRVVAVTERDLTERVIVTGLIAAVEEVQVQPLIEGQPIEALRADIGDYVETGAVLAVLSSSTLELQKSQSLAGLAQAKAAIAQAQAQQIEAGAARDEAKRVAARTARLKDQGSATGAASDSANAALLAAQARVDLARETLAAARAQADLAEAQLANVELMLTRTEVRAPYAGRITARNATIGAVASAQGAPMFVLEKEGALELRADVPEASIAALRPGQRAALRAAGLVAGDIAEGRLRLIEPAIDPTTRQGRARITLPANPDLKAGMFAEATIILREARLLAVPLSALGSADGRETVLRVEDGIVGEVPVMVVLRDGGLAGIAAAEGPEGLQAGDLIIAKAGAFVRPGDRITPIREPETRQSDSAPGGTW